jgi:hypothetical protein
MFLEMDLKNNVVSFQSPARLADMGSPRKAARDHRNGLSRLVR